MLNLQNNLGFLLNTSANALNTLMQRRIAADGIEVPLEQVKLLIFIGFHNGTTQQNICSETRKTKTGVSRLVDALVKKGLVERKENLKDRRNKNLFITKKGVQVKEGFYPIAIKNLGAIEQELGPAESEELKMHLRKVKEIVLNKLNKKG